MTLATCSLSGLIGIARSWSNKELSCWLSYSTQSHSLWEMATTLGSQNRIWHFLLLDLDPLPTLWYCHSSWTCNCIGMMAWCWWWILLFGLPAAPVYPWKNGSPLLLLVCRHSAYWAREKAIDFIQHNHNTIVAREYASLAYKHH